MDRGTSRMRSGGPPRHLLSIMSINTGMMSSTQLLSLQSAAVAPAASYAVTESIHTYKEIFCIGYSTVLQHHRKWSPYP